MPIYEYKCSECGAHLEKMQKVSDAPLTVCEVCGGKLEKQWSLSGFQFKGAGWYVTDYSSKSKEPGAEKTSKTETSGSSDNSDKAGIADKTEKTSAESTAAPESASNKSNDTVPNQAKDAAATTKD